MPLPTAPTSTTIATEALRKFGITVPNSTQIQRAINYGLETVKDDLWLRARKWKSLQLVDYIPTIVGVSKYQVPTTFLEVLSANLFDGPSRSTLASVGGLTSLTLASGENAASVGALI